MGKEDVTWLMSMILLIIFAVFMAAVANADVTDAPMDNVVRLIVPGGGAGTGFLLGDGRMITAKHVAIHCDTIMLATYNDGTTHIIAAEHITLSDTHDIAVIKFCRKGKLLTIYDGDLHIGYPIYVASMPFSYDWRFSSVGIIGSNPLTIDGQYKWIGVRATDLTSVPGMSGGPVFNDDDEVVGIIVASAGMIVLIEDNKTILEFLNGEQNKTKEVQTVP
jgi:S1-C subfamily serine protease